MRKPKKILIVDDDYDFSESFQLVLLEDGHDAVSASNGREAIVKYAEFNPDMVLLDIKMPGIDGYETFLQIIELDPDARVMFTSAYDIGNEKYENAKEHSLLGVLSKPIDFTKLRRMISAHAK